MKELEVKKSELKAEIDEFKAHIEERQNKIHEMLEAAKASFPPMKRSEDTGIDTQLSPEKEVNLPIPLVPTCVGEG